MGFFKTLFIILVPGIGGCSYFAFRLGSELPIAARHTGRQIGMMYNYMKILLKHITPRSNATVDLVRKMRQTGQQAFAFSNEVKWNLLDTKPLIKQALPDLSEDPFDKFGLGKEEERKKERVPDGSSFMKVTFEERERLMEKVANREREKKTLYKL